MQEILKKIELATDNNVVTKSGKDNNAKDTDLSPEEAQELKAERDYWEREAKNMKEVLREEITGIIFYFEVSE